MNADNQSNVSDDLSEIGDDTMAKLQDQVEHLQAKPYANQSEEEPEEDAPAPDWGDDYYTPIIEPEDGSQMENEASNQELVADGVAVQTAEEIAAQRSENAARSKKMATVGGKAGKRLRFEDSESVGGGKKNRGKDAIKSEDEGENEDGGSELDATDQESHGGVRSRADKNAHAEESDSADDAGQNDIEDEVGDAEGQQAAAQPAPAAPIRKSSRLATNALKASKAATSATPTAPAPAPAVSSTRKTRQQKSKATKADVQIVADEEEEDDDDDEEEEDLSDADSDPEDPDIDIEPEEPKSRAARRTIEIKPHKSPKAQAKKSTQQKKTTNAPKTRSKSAKTKTAAAAADQDDDADDNTISTTQMRNTITDLLTTSMHVYHDFVSYTTQHDGVAAGDTAEREFATALGKRKRTRAQREEGREEGKKRRGRK